MGNLVEHAQRELEIAGAFDKDSDYAGELGKAVLELIKVFARQGHSGFSASYTANLFTRLVKYEPLSPLKGTDDEWMKLEGCEHFQNKRCPSIFKKDDGTCTYVDALVFKVQSGGSWSGSAIDTSTGNKVSSAQEITFPFMPKTFVIDVTEKELSKDNWELYINDHNQLEKALSYFSKGIVLEDE